MESTIDNILIGIGRISCFDYEVTIIIEFQVPKWFILGRIGERGRVATLGGCIEKSKSEEILFLIYCMDSSGLKEEIQLILHDLVHKGEGLMDQLIV